MSLTFHNMRRRQAAAKAQKEAAAKAEAKAAEVKPKKSTK